MYRETEAGETPAAAAMFLTVNFMPFTSISHGKILFQDF